MQKTLLYGLIFFIFSVGGFAVTLYLMSNNQKKIPSVDGQGLSNVISQDYDYKSANDLFLEGKALYKQKKYKKAFVFMEAAFTKAKTRSDLRKKSADYLGYGNIKGQGIKKNIEKAYFYYSLPELSKSPWANYFLGIIYADKKFSQFNLEKAKKYLEKAKSLGIKIADKALASLEM